MGRPASRARTSARTLAAWTPLLVCFALLVWRAVDVWSTCEASVLRAFGAGVVFLEDHHVLQVSVLLLVAGAVWSLIVPRRGPHDHLAGTHLVPD